MEENNNERGADIEVIEEVLDDLQENSSEPSD